MPDLVAAAGGVMALALPVMVMLTLSEGQTMPEAFMVSRCGCLATITVLHTASSRKKSTAC